MLVSRAAPYALALICRKAGSILPALASSAIFLSASSMLLMLLSRSRYTSAALSSASVSAPMLS